MLLVTGCFISVGTPRAGHPIAAREGQTLVFGRIRAFAFGEEYYPWDPLRVTSVPMYLALLRLGPRSVAPGLRPLADGRFYWWLPPGDYALVANPRDAYSSGTSDVAMQDMHVLALLRVPPGPAPAYAGSLVLDLAAPTLGGIMRLEYGFGEQHVEDDRGDAVAAFTQRFGAPAAAPVVSLMCAGEAVPGFTDPQLFPRGRALLDAGCRR